MKQFSKVILAITLVLTLILTAQISFGNKNEDFNFNLVSDKTEYLEGETIKLNLDLTNYQNLNINSKISGEIIIGDRGINVECFQATLPKNQQATLDLGSLQAGFSNSNIQSITSIYQCDNTNFQSTKTQSSTTNYQQINQNQNKEEIVIIQPFILKYTINNTKKKLKSNSLTIKIKSNPNQQQQNQNNNQQQEQQEQTQQNQKEHQNNQNQNQNQENNQNSEQSQNSQNNNQQQEHQNTLNQNQQNALSNNQQNQQSVNELKQQINQQKQDSNFTIQELNQTQNITNNQNQQINSSNQTKIPENEIKQKINYWKYFWIILTILIITLAIRKFLKERKSKNKKPIKEQILEKFIEPKYQKYLRLVEKQKTDKNKAKFLSLSIRAYLEKTQNTKENLTNLEAIKLTKNKQFQNLLKTCNEIEFKQKTNKKIDFTKEVKNLKKEFQIN